MNCPKLKAALSSIASDVGATVMYRESPELTRMNVQSFPHALQLSNPLWPLISMPQGFLPFSQFPSPGSM